MNARSFTSESGRAHTRRGAILLEIVLALGLFVATAMTLLGVVSSAIDSLTRSRDLVIGSEHARNALAMIEAGIASPDTLNGPVAPWSGGNPDEFGLDPGGDDSGFGEPYFGEPAGTEMAAGFGDGFGTGGDAGFLAEPGETGWALEITTEPARVPGLTLVIVRAYRVDTAGDELLGGASVTLRQVVALSGGTGGGADDDAGAISEFGSSESGFGSGGAP